MILPTALMKSFQSSVISNRKNCIPLLTSELLCKERISISTMFSPPSWQMMMAVKTRANDINRSMLTSIAGLWNRIFLINPLLTDQYDGMRSRAFFLGHGIIDMAYLLSENGDTGVSRGPRWAVFFQLLNCEAVYCCEYFRQVPLIITTDNCAPPEI